MKSPFSQMPRSQRLEQTLEHLLKKSRKGKGLISRCPPDSSCCWGEGARLSCELEAFRS